MLTDLILGTAGHIDHGKTALVKALTGVDTDRLPEEKRRGITIELGFAELLLGDFRLGIVDVPGHERFVRNMLAGATGVDLALLVVAADESVKPQTREHLEILRLLGLDAGVIALTKCDLVDDDWLELIEFDVRELVSGTFLEAAPIVRTSAAAGTGMIELRSALATAAGGVAEGVRRRARSGPFRMAIDRVFAVAGHGTVVTGSVLSGVTCVGEHLVIEPGGIEVRVRGLQNHDRAVEEVHRGQRAAINLAGVHHGQLTRGQEICTPGHLRSSRILTVRVEQLAATQWRLKHRDRVHIHIGTAETMAAVSLLEESEIPPGRAGLAQLFLRQGVVSVWSQPFIVRSESPVMTIGGGMVLDPTAERIRRRETSRIRAVARLASPDPMERASAALLLAGWKGWQSDELPRTAGVDQTAEATSALEQRGELCRLNLSPTRSLSVHRDTFLETADRIERALEKLHALQPLRRMVERGAVVRLFEYVGGPAVVDAVLDEMVHQGRVTIDSHSVGLAGRGPKLSAAEKNLLEQIVDEIARGGFRPPTLPEIQARTNRNQASVPQLFELAAAEGRIVPVTDEIYIHRDSLGQLREMLEARMRGSEGLTLSEIREILETTRKYAVPICEYLDRIGFTRRSGDLRILAPSPKKEGAPSNA
jgi:selenocysteine-specific elongation factor